MVLPTPCCQNSCSVSMFLVHTNSVRRGNLTVCKKRLLIWQGLISSYSLASCLNLSKRWYIPALIQRSGLWYLHWFGFKRSLITACPLAGSTSCVRTLKSLCSCKMTKCVSLAPKWNKGQRLKKETAERGRLNKEFRERSISENKMNVPLNFLKVI